MRSSVRMCPNQRGEAGAPPNRNAAEDPLHESRDAHDCARGRIGPRAAVACWRDHCASSGCLRATPYAWYHDACVVSLSEKNQYSVSVCLAKMLFVLAEWLDFILVGPDGSGLDQWGIRAA